METGMPFLYQSTRGQAPDLDFRGVTMTGLAADGGLYVPKAWPQFSAADIRAMQGKTYQEVAFRVMRPFVEGALPDDTLRSLITRAYAVFDDPAITPLRQLDEDHWLLELFHGPTLAFKDIALQLLGHLFEHFLSRSGDHMTVLGATSGDTGSAAIAATANRRNIETFILYPHGRPSDTQRRQMTCVDAPNIHAIAVEGSFDDCQAIVKDLFNDATFRGKHHLAAVNSINWARLLAQIVYYFVAAVRLGAPDRPVSFVVPTGNFGNVYAAWAARQCGLPVSRLAVASNRNDILTRFFASGRMETGEVAATLSPSMDIQVSSNFERLLFELCGHDAAALRQKMEELRVTGRFAVTPLQLGAARQMFTAATVDDDATLAVIRDTHARTGVVLDPHTAVGVAASQILNRELPGPVVMAATAHPAKFPEVIQRAINLTLPMVGRLADLLRKPEREIIIPLDIQKVRAFLSSRGQTDVHSDYDAR
jgi:threonine synthase